MSMRRRPLAILAVALSSVAAAKPHSARGTSDDAANGPTERVDAAGSLAPLICSADRIGLHTAAWSAGIFDAQIEGRYLEKLGSRSVRLEDAARKAKALARTKRYGSYAFGSCPNGDAFAVAFPAPSGLAGSAPRGKLSIPTRMLESRCASFRVDAAASASGSPVELTIADGQVDVGRIGTGTVSVTCQPKAPRWQGPVVWYLLPLGEGPQQEVPESDALTSAAGTTAALTSWIGRIRLREGLPVLTSSPELSAQAETLAVDGSLTHDRSLLRKTKERLAESHVEFLGEDRVRGVTAADMAWLLWNSPRHRGLLLSKDATAVGIGLRGVGAEHLAVIVTAKATPMTTAKAKAGKTGG